MNEAKEEFDYQYMIDNANSYTLSEEAIEQINKANEEAKKNNRQNQAPGLTI